MRVRMIDREIEIEKEREREGVGDILGGRVFGGGRETNEGE